MMTSVYVIHFGFDTWWRLTHPPPSLTHTTTWVKDHELILCTSAVRQRNGLQPPAAPLHGLHRRLDCSASVTAPSTSHSGYASSSAWVDLQSIEVERRRTYRNGYPLEETGANKGAATRPASETFCRVRGRSNRWGARR